MDHEKLKDFINTRDRFALHNRMEVVEVGEGYAVARMEAADHLRNGLGMIHGGALFTLADLALAGAANSHGTVSVAISASMNFVRPALTGTIRAEAREVSRGSRVATYDVVVTDAEGNALASFQGLAYRKKDPLGL